MRLMYMWVGILMDFMVFIEKMVEVKRILKVEYY